MLTLAGDLYKPLCLLYIIHNMKVIDNTNTVTKLSHLTALQIVEVKCKAALRMALWERPYSH